jgi:4-amino-4-deoxy-L-arabinose transferase-like glycosyltransferase
LRFLHIIAIVPSKVSGNLHALTRLGFMYTKYSLFGRLKTNLILVGIVIAIPALYINLDLLPLIGDESIRALVSLEMMLSGDYITPTLNGEPYFNKPPLYNWILTGFFKLFNRNDELIVRLPTTFFLIAYCYTIYWWIKKELGTQLGILSSLMFLTCGRILFWDSFLGLIDIAFSWIIFLNFMVIWHFFRRQSYTLLFLFSYALIAFSFLLKGLPSLLFQGITLLVIFFGYKIPKRLFSWQHLTGVLLFILITGTYYLFYYFKNPDNIGIVFLRIFTESTQKSAFGTGFLKTLLHFFAFPLEVLYHFLPWTIFAIFMFHKKILRHALSNHFIRYCLIVFLCNILVYWLSPITYPRYLLMLIPLLFTVLLYLARYHSFLRTPHYRIIKIVFGGILGILLLANLFLPMIYKPVIPVDYVYLKAFLLFLAGILVIYISSVKQKGNLILSVGMIFLISRIGFNLFLIPYRQSESWANKCRSDAISLGKETKGQDLFFLTDTITIPNAYYLTRERNEILRHDSVPGSGPYYIVGDTSRYGAAFKKEYSMRIPYQNRSYFIGKFNSPLP